MISESDGSPRKSEVQDRRLSLIDFSSADDSLLDPAASAGKPNPLNHQHSENQDEHAESWYTPNSKNFEDAATKLQQWEHEPLTSGAGKSKNKSKCNLRKSLAWDTAFFTSAGVLDAEELSSIIEGVEKEALPGIEEDVYRSCDSLSTLESDSLTLESVEIEGDLFEDVRASIQKSSTKSQQLAASAKTKLRCSSSSELPGFQTHDPSRKVGLVSRIKMKAPLTSKNPSTGMQGSGKMTNKNNPVFPQLPQKPIATRRESSISKPGKLPSPTISSKRVSLGDLHVKSEKDKAKRAVGDRVSLVTKASIGDSRGNMPKSGDSRGNVPKPTRPSKLPSGPVRSIKTKSATTTSSAGSIKPLSSSTAVRTPSRNASKNKTETGYSSLSGLMSSSKLSSSISPASSISDWSSESSSSFSMAKHVCNSSRSSIESSSSRKIFSDTYSDQDISSQNIQSDSSVKWQEAQHTGFISQSARAAPGATVVPPAAGKPSGLRLPSPKIGFFDGVKSSVRTPRGGMQSHSVVPRGLPKQGKGSPSDGQNKTKPGKLQTARSITSIEDKELNNQQNSHSNPLHESLDVAINTSGAVQNVKSSSDMPMGAAENTSPSHLLERTHPDLHPLKGANNQDETHYDYQVDFLSKQVGLVDLNFETDDGSFQGNSDNMELSSHKELFDGPIQEEFLKGLSITGLSVSPTSFDMASSIRRPFAVKDSFCNMDGSVFAESTVVSEVKPTNLPVPDSIQRENN